MMMVLQEHQRVLICLLYVTVLFTGVATQTSSQCKFEFNVPSGIGSCTSTSTDVSNKMTAMTAGLDRFHLLYVRHNSVVQSQISKVRMELHQNARTVDSLQTQMQASQNGGSGVDNSAVLKLLDETKDFLLNAIHDSDNRIFNLTLWFKQNFVDKDNLHTALQAKIFTQEQDLRKAASRISSLEANMKQLTSGAVIPNPGTQNPELKKLETRLKALEGLVHNTDILQLTVDVSDIQNELTASRNSLVENTRNVKALNLQFQGLSSHVSSNELRIDTVQSALKKDISVGSARVQQLESLFSSLSMAVKSLKTKVDHLTSEQLTLKNEEVTDSQQLGVILGKLNLLSNRSTDILIDTNKYSHELSKLQKLVHNLSAMFDPNQLRILQTFANSKVAKEVIGFHGIKQELEALVQKVTGLSKIFWASVTSPQSTTTLQPVQTASQSGLGPHGQSTLKLNIPTLPSVNTSLPTVVAPLGQSTPKLNMATFSPPLIVPIGQSTPKLNIPTLPPVKATSATVVAPLGQSTNKFSVPTLLNSKTFSPPLVAPLGQSTPKLNIPTLPPVKTSSASMVAPLGQSTPKRNMATFSPPLIVPLGQSTPKLNIPTLPPVKASSATMVAPLGQSTPKLNIPTLPPVKASSATVVAPLGQSTPKFQVPTLLPKIHNSIKIVNPTIVVPTFPPWTRTKKLLVPTLPSGPKPPSP